MSIAEAPSRSLSTDSPTLSTRRSPYPYIPSSSPVTPHRPLLRLSPSIHGSRPLSRPLNRTRASLEEVQPSRGGSRGMDWVERPEAGPSRPREVLALPRGAGSAAGSRGGSAAGSRAVTETIDLTGDSSEDEVEVLRERVVAPRATAAPFQPRARILSPPARRTASPARRRLEEDEYRQYINNADRAIDRHGRGINALLAGDGPRRERFPSPPTRAGPRPRIGLGGAVIRNGGQQINYDAQRNRQRREVRVQHDLDEYIPPPEYEDADDLDQFDIPGAYNIGRRHRGPAAEARANAIRNVRREDEAARDADIRRQLRRSAAMRRDMEQERRALEEEEAQFRNLDAGWMQRLGGLVGLGLGRFGMGGVNANAIAAAMDGVGLHGFGGQAGRAPLDIDSLTAKVNIQTHQSTKGGFVDNWDLEASRPIELDDAGDAVKPTPIYLRCGNCDEPLLLSSAYDSPEDRVWALRCGHMIHEGCLGRISTPTKGQTANITHFGANGAILDDDGSARKKRKTTSKKVPKPSVFRWQCPVKGCGVWHASEKKVDEEKWTQTEDAGALAVYA